MFDIYNTYKDAAEKYFTDHILNKNNFSEQNLFEIMKYAVESGGKRIRPILLLSAYNIFSPDWQKALPFACSIELIHCYSLTHDDLPAMDNDDLRRGKPTCHKKFSEFGAILAGDALLNLAFETMLANKTNVEANLLLRASKIIADAAGANGMCAGQMSDMLEGVKTLEELLYTHKNKTGALIKASVTAGAVLGGASEKEIEILSEYAELMGLIFQIKDDILDVTSNTDTLGKQILSDEKNNKTTYITEFGLEKCEEILLDYYNQAISVLEKLNKDEKISFLKSLTKYFLDRDK